MVALECMSGSAVIHHVNTPYLLRPTTVMRLKPADLRKWIVLNNTADIIRRPSTYTGLDVGFYFNSTPSQ
jgi:hypothetical protein